MLQLTDRATEAIQLIVTSADVPAGGGVRIYAKPINEESAAIDMAVVETPDPSDAVIDQGEAHVFVEQGAAMLLDDKVLDASLEGEQVKFSVEDQGTGGDFSHDGRPT